MVGFQGLIKDAGGIPINGNVDLEFRIFDAKTGGSIVDMNGDGAANNADVDTRITQATNGFVSTKFGPVFPTAFADFVPGESRWLEVTVDGAPLSRVEMATPPGIAQQVNRQGTDDGVLTTDDPAFSFRVPGSARIEDSLFARFISALSPLEFLTAGTRRMTIADNGQIAMGPSLPDPLREEVQITGALSVEATAADRIVISPGTNEIISTMQNEPLEIRLGNTRVARFEPEDPAGGIISPNVLFGWSGNSVDPAQFAQTISGGGVAIPPVISSPNTISGGDGGTIGGGIDNAVSGGNIGTIGGGDGNSVQATGATIGGGVGNTASGIQSTVPGGVTNEAVGNYSFAAGRRAKANHPGSFVWADSADADCTSTVDDEFRICAGGGVEVEGGIHASGTITSGSSITIDGVTNTISSTSGTISFDNELLTTTGGIQHGNPIDFTGSADEAILRIGTKDLIRRKTSNGAVLIGADDAMIIGDGESPDLVAANIASLTAENTYVSSDNNVFIETNLQGGVWANRHEFVFTDTGRLGIGTGTPARALHVVGPSPSNPSEGQLRIEPSETTGVAGTGSAIEFSGHDGNIPRTWGAVQALKENSTVGNIRSFMRFSTRGSSGLPVERMRIDSNGNVGIGTTSTGSHKFRVSTTTPFVEMMQFDTTDNLSSGDDMLALEIGATSSDSAQFIECQRGASVVFHVDGDGEAIANGHTCVGANCGPFAAMMRVSEGADSVEPGDVMMINVNAPRSTVKSTGARSTLVAGICSASAGFLSSEHSYDDLRREAAAIDSELAVIALGLDAATADQQSALSVVEMGRAIGEVPLATMGVVPCKVSAENGAIRPGDLLVTSSTPGHAMRDESPKIGTVLGKALESLSGGTGVIDVLVTLQ